MTGERWENPIRRRLRECQPVFGCTITSPSLDIAARAATAGFHFLWLEMEHSPVTLETVRNIVLATRALPAVPFARAGDRGMDRQAGARRRSPRRHFPVRQHACAREDRGRGVPVSAGRPARIGRGARVYILAG